MKKQEGEFGKNDFQWQTGTEVVLCKLREQRGDEEREEMKGRRKNGMIKEARVAGWAVMGFHFLFYFCSANHSSASPEREEGRGGSPQLWDVHFNVFVLITFKCLTARPVCSSSPSELRRLQVNADSSACVVTMKRRKNRQKYANHTNQIKTQRAPNKDSNKCSSVMLWCYIMNMLLQIPVKSYVDFYFEKFWSSTIFPTFPTIT